MIFAPIMVIVGVLFTHTIKIASEIVDIRVTIFAITLIISLFFLIVKYFLIQNRTHAKIDELIKDEMDLISSQNSKH